MNRLLYVIQEYWLDIIICSLFVPQVAAFAIYGWTGYDFGLTEERIFILMLVGLIGLFAFWVKKVLE